jgi:hypothetical protein
MDGSTGGGKGEMERAPGRDGGRDGLGGMEGAVAMEERRDLWSGTIGGATRSVAWEVSMGRERTRMTGQ